jgi:arginyl-tRNA--protein-N-Asp/Glu arginylyltransferase
MEYLHWDEKKIDEGDDINKLYDQGYVFTRIDKGMMHQTRSVRIDISRFNLTSENRRILRKGENIVMEIIDIPYQDYSWKIGKMAKDFYDKKANGAFSANKIKELITTKDNFNTLFKFSDNVSNAGYAISFKNNEMIHYCYPFYEIEKSIKDMGLIMMNKTINFAKENNYKYVYLGSLQRPSDVYKLQFEGIEWFDGKEWKRDLEEVKKLLVNV